jgi:uncharacterized protein
MLFEWDESERQANLAKHHIDFRDAKRVFDGPVFERMDRRRGEDRVFAIGLMEDIEIVAVDGMRGKRRNFGEKGTSQ